MPRHEVTAVDHRATDVAAAIVDVQRAAYQVEAELIGYDRIPGLVETAADVAALDLTILGVHDDGRLVGLVGYTRGDDVVEIERLAVAPAQFRRGVGQALVAAVHERESDATRFEVSTGAANAPGVGLYTALGYRRVDTRVLDGCPVVFLVRAPGSGGR